MRRVGGWRRWLALGALVATCFSGFPGTAFAYGPGSGEGDQPPGPGGNSDGKGNISATVGAVVYDLSKNGSGTSVGTLTSTTTWTPPAC